MLERAMVGTMGSLTFRNLYQLGFVVRDAERACAKVGARFGIPNFRILRHSPQITTAHAYSGDMMIELVQVSDDGPKIFAEYLPDHPDGVSFHHHGYRVFEPHEWAQISAAADASGLPVFRQTARDGHLQTTFVDLRGELGVYAEYVFLSSALADYYDDVPRH